MSRSFHAVALAAAIVLGCRPTPPPSDDTRDPIASDICALVADGVNFNGRSVVVHARVKAGVHRELILSDPHCSRTVRLAITDRLSNSPEVHKLRNLVFAGFPYPAVERAQATARLTGVLHVRESVPTRILELTAIDAVTKLD